VDGHYDDATGRWVGQAGVDAPPLPGGIPRGAAGGPEPTKGGGGADPDAMPLFTSLEDACRQIEGRETVQGMLEAARRVNAQLKRLAQKRAEALGLQQLGTGRAAAAAPPRARFQRGARGWAEGVDHKGTVLDDGDRICIEDGRGGEAGWNDLPFALLFAAVVAGTLVLGVLGVVPPPPPTPDPCSSPSNPCRNGASCAPLPERPTSVACTCAYGYTGELCGERVPWLSTDACNGRLTVGAREGANRAACAAVGRGCRYTPAATAAAPSCTPRAAASCAQALRGSSSPAAPSSTGRGGAAAVGRRAQCEGGGAGAATSGNVSARGGAGAAPPCEYASAQAAVAEACVAASASACADVDPRRPGARLLCAAVNVSAGGSSAALGPAAQQGGGGGCAWAAADAATNTSASCTAAAAAACAARTGGREACECGGGGGGGESFLRVHWVAVPKALRARRASRRRRRQPVKPLRRGGRVCVPASGGVPARGLPRIRHGTLRGRRPQPGAVPLLRRRLRAHRGRGSRGESVVPARALGRRA
jgi:hypothetical protein